MALLLDPDGELGGIGDLFTGRRELGDLHGTQIIGDLDGAVQIWSWWETGLAAVAAMVREVAERINADVGGELTFNAVPFDAAVKAAYQERARGPATDFWAWTRTLGQPTSPG